MPLPPNVIRFPLEERMGDDRPRAKLAEIVRPVIPRNKGETYVDSYQNIIDLFHKVMEREGK